MTRRCDYLTWLAICAACSQIGTFLWGNRRTGEISIRLSNGEIKLVQT